MTSNRTSYNQSDYGHNLKDSVPFILMLVLLSASAFAVPPVGVVDEITGWNMESEVPIGDYLGLNFVVENVGNEGVPNHHCTISIYEWRDNVSYPLDIVRLRDVCLESDAFSLTGETATGDGIPAECFMTTTPSGEFYFTHLITRERGFNVAPETGSYIGGYGTYKLEAHCGITADLVESANFTVTTAKEPTIIIDYMRIPIDYPAHTAGVIFIIITGAICIYWIKERLLN